MACTRPLSLFTTLSTQDSHDSGNRVTRGWHARCLYDAAHVGVAAPEHPIRAKSATAQRPSSEPLVQHEPRRLAYFLLSFFEVVSATVMP